MPAGPLIFALLLIVALVGGMAYAVASSPIGNREDEADKAADEAFRKNMDALTKGIAEAREEFAFVIAKAEQEAGVPVYKADPRQNAPTSATIQ